MMTGRSTVSHLRIKQGSAFTHTYVRRYASDRQPIDNSGMQARMHVRRALTDDVPVLVLASEDVAERDGTITLGGVDGTITLDIGATVTAAADFARGVFDIELYDPADPDNVECAIEGTVSIERNVTR